VEQNAVRTIKAAHRTYVLRNGRITLSGDRDELAATADLATAYLGV
jgi:ABC-type branched-subunit amino acid transport system ATPase component